MTDAKVLAAQQWVNATYGGVDGYDRCPEDGRTGWSTMFSLIEGVQHELGIGPVVASFGPTTAARFDALGPVGVGWSANTNIVKILQHGLFAKGYWGADETDTGRFTGVTRQAVVQLRLDMGIPTGDGVVSVDIARCILNMDAYVVVAGGTDKIRGIQCWLNSRYWQRDAYNIGPCDGIYSRDVQKALMIAIQYELGLDPSGNFGPGTQAGLRAHTLHQGDTGIFVELFSAACVFNEPIGLYRTNRRDTFDAALADYVRAFQTFSLLAASGAGDYATWAQLLISTGDADRAVSGSDTRFEITTSRGAWLKANGYQVIGRYLYDPPGSTLDKAIKPGELSTIFAAGLTVFPIYQDNARDVTDFTYTTGLQHALNAHNLATGYGFNQGTVIYFAVDYDATQDEIDSAVLPYFQGIAAGLASQGKRYLHGVYGSRNVCANVTGRTFARFSFVSGMSWGFSGNLGFPLPDNWSFNQIKEFTVTNGSDVFDLDRDVARGNDPGAGSVNDPAGPANAFLTYVAHLYDLAIAYGGDRPTSQLVMEYIRHVAYGGQNLIDNVGWAFLIGEYDHAFVDYVDAHQVSVTNRFKDPFTGYDLDAEHLMATANGHFLKAPDADRGSANGGDVAGWAGDLMTFYADWRNSEEQYASGWAFCDAKLARPGVASSFGFDDLITDADGYLLAQAVRGGSTIAEAVSDHYSAGGGGLHRFTNYFQHRWGTAQNCQTAAHNALVAPDITLGLARKQLITLHGVLLLPSTLVDLPGGATKLDGFEQGFVDALQARIDLESTANNEGSLG